MDHEACLEQEAAHGNAVKMGARDTMAPWPAASCASKGQAAACKGLTVMGMTTKMACWLDK